MTPTYSVAQEAWYASRDDPPAVAIHLSHPDGGIAWEFRITWISLSGGLAAHLEMFDDAFAALVAIPDFLRSLAEAGPGVTVEGVVGILRSRGFTDITERVNPYAPPDV